jgi:hypothetical protein
MSETAIVNACITLLTLKKIFHYRNNTGALATAKGGFIRFGAVGSPDIVAVINGVYHAIEVKTVTGRQSDNQKAFQARLEAAGGVYWLIRSVDELDDLL